MNKFFAFTGIIMLIIASTRYSAAQDLPFQKGLEPVSLTAEELFVLSNVKELKLPDAYKGDNAPLLPPGVDNSTQPYFRPITWQSGYECGQSAGIAFNFTYEIDRLRQLPANVPGNQYPTHFTWDFLNNANNYQGVSFFDSWEIVRACGNMNVTDYGGALNTGGYTRWISGYDKYYNGMQNRLTEVKAIRVDNPEGLQTLKYWLFDHLEGSPVGGVANIYAQYFSPPVNILPAGTPEGGKWVQTNWGGSPSHAWTICGYNDSIRYDFNNDGQYTNNLDINNDGVVDMHDWEIGGLKFANGYAGTGWCNSGFCYTMYKNLADNIGSGGIWNHTVYVVEVKSTCSPKLTMKITLKHTSRNKLKVTAGVNPDPGALVPSYVHEYPIFNYQGGDLYMQGGSTEADKTIEFGLDLTPLINQVPANQPAKYFLQVQESDPGGTATGEIVGWSLIDYTGSTPVILNYPGSNVPLQNNTLTRLSVNYTLFVTKPSINNNSLPPAQLYQPYSATLTASAGTPPYKWDVKLEYPETTAPAAFPAVTAQQLTLSNNNTGFVIKDLPFGIPFYQRMVNKLYIYADGYILFDDQPYTYPYLIDKTLLFRQTAIICPFMTDLMVYPSLSQGVWYEASGSSVTIRWKASVYNMQGSTNLNFAVKLHANGTIEFYYGDMVYPAGTAWTGGISSGDNSNYQTSLYSNGPSITSNTLNKFSSCGFPPEMELSDNGVFSGTPTYSYQNAPIKFRVTDNNNISNTKVLNFSSFGLLINQTVESGGDSLIEFGETAHISLVLNNIGTQNFSQLNFSIRTTDPFITITDSLEGVPLISGGQTLTLPNAFTFMVAQGVPDQHPFTIVLHVQSMEQGFNRNLDLVALAPLFMVKQALLDDGDNGMLDAGETADLMVTYQNGGSAKVSGSQFIMTALDPLVTVNSAQALQALLMPDSSCTLAFNITGSDQAPAEYAFPLKIDITANNGFSDTDTVYLFSGQIIEDFETGNFEKFPWSTGGQAPWLIESGVKYEGSYSARSGWLGDNMESKFILNVKVLTGGPLTFYKYVSCEHDPSGNHDYDYLSFQVDGIELARWDGEIQWSPETFFISEGYHTITWIYHKDYSISSGWDGCLIDFITFPLLENAVPYMEVSPASISETLQPGQQVTRQVNVLNSGGGILEFSAVVFDTTTRKKDMPADNLSTSWLTCSVQEFTPGNSFSWVFTLKNESTDNENIRELKIDFPPGTLVDSATSFVGGSLGDMVFLGTPGSAASLLWHGEGPASSGVLKPGETAYATVYGSSLRALMRDIFMVYDIRGDNMGNLPHHKTGSVRVSNTGLPNGWLTLAGNAGTLATGESAMIDASLSTTGLSSGIYRCDMVVRDKFNNLRVIPVTLNIPFPVGIATGESGEEYGPVCRPNPASGPVVFTFGTAEPTSVALSVFSQQGIRVHTSELPRCLPGNHEIPWNLEGPGGEPLPNGIYLCRLVTSSGTRTTKVIILR